MKANIEARRSCYLAFPRILSSTIHRLSHCKYPSTLYQPFLDRNSVDMSDDVVNSIYETLLGGLDDYSIDERGDVGSWIRIACIQGLTSFSELLISNAKSIPSFDTYFPPSNYHRAIAGILKQGVERLDNVRQEAGESFMRLLVLGLPALDNAISWEIPGLNLLKELFEGYNIFCFSRQVFITDLEFSETENPGWNDGEWLYPRAVRLLDIVQCRKSVLTGLVLSIGSRTESTVSVIELIFHPPLINEQQRPLAVSLVTYAQSLTITSEDAEYDLNSLVEDLLNHAKTNVASNAVIVPVLKTFNVLLEADSLTQLSQDTRGLKRL
jgi:hypothetical protein